MIWVMWDTSDLFVEQGINSMCFVAEIRILFISLEDISGSLISNLRGKGLSYTLNTFNWSVFEMRVLNHWDRKNKNNIGKLPLTKVEGDGLIGASGCHHILAIPHQLTNELMSLESFIFQFGWQLQSIYMINTDPALRAFVKDHKTVCSDRSPVSDSPSDVIIKTWLLSSQFGQIVMITSFIGNRITHIWTMWN
jgi:hypothetical protein